jgi:hypothetical protein
MDLRTAARIKENARLKPVKDISVLYGELIANTNPEKHSEIRDNLVLAIDAAESEYQILTSEIAVMSKLFLEWDREIAACRTDIQNLQAEMLALDQEREEIEARGRTLSRLAFLKEEFLRANVPGLRDDLLRLLHENEEAEREIAATELSNEKRCSALGEVMLIFEKCLLKEPPRVTLTELEV